MVEYDDSTVCQGRVTSVNISKIRGTIKTPVKEILLTECGVKGDAHNSKGDVQVSMLRHETIKLFSKKHNKEFKPGDFAENITIEGFNQVHFNLLDRLIIDNTEMEITRIGRSCHEEDSIMTKEGIFLRVLKQGAIKPGSMVWHISRAFNFKVIVMSREADDVEYVDTCGHEIQQILLKHFEGIKRNISIDYVFIPDDVKMLKQEIEKAVSGDCDVILTTGGTGIGPGDITYDVVSSLCDKMIPGIMEFIRMKYGQTNPHALLSRSVAGVIKDVLIYTLPGSRKAVKEYLDELLNTMEHLIYVLNGLSH